MLRVCRAQRKELLKISLLFSEKPIPKKPPPPYAHPTHSHFFFPPIPLDIRVHSVIHSVRIVVYVQNEVKMTERNYVRNNRLRLSSNPKRIQNYLLECIQIYFN